MSPAISRFRGAYAMRTLLFVLIRAAWIILAAGLLLVATDTWFALNPTARLALEFAAIVVTVISAITSYTRLHRSRSYDRMVARMVEEGDPHLENVLINALDFEERLAAAGGAATANLAGAATANLAGADLMRAEIQRAETRAGTIQDTATLTPEGSARELRVLLVLAVAALVLTVVFWRVFIAVIPRYLLPFADFPPYSPTVFAVAPGSIQVDYGESIKVTVTASRVIPQAMELVLWDASGAELGALQMLHSGKGEFFQTIESVRDDLRYFARIPHGRSRRYPVAVNKKPRVEEIVVAYDFPEYTRLDNETRMLTDNILRGFKDTSVTLTVRSNRPLKSGAATINGSEYALAAADGVDGITATFPIRTAGEFSIDIVDVEGHEALGAAKGFVEIAPDNRPEVTITAPGMDSFALPDAKVPIEITAADDIAIAEVAILRNHNQSQDARKSIYEDAGGPGAVTVTETLDLADLGVRPGDIIEYYATARDNLPDGPQSAASPSFALRIISEEEYREFMQSQMTAEDLTKKYEDILDELRKLAEEQVRVMKKTEAMQNASKEGTIPDAQALAENQAAQERLAQAAAELAERLREEAANPAVFDVESAYKEALKEFAQRLNQAQGHMQNAEQNLSDSQQNPSQGLPAAMVEQDEAMKKLKQNVEDFQQGIQKANENLENVANVMADVETFKYLYSLQKGLERQIRYYREKENPTLDEQIRLKELSERQAEVLESLAQLKESLREHAGDLDKLEAEQDKPAGESL